MTWIQLPQLKQETGECNLAEKAVTNAKSQFPSGYFIKTSTSHINTPLQWSLEIHQRYCLKSIQEYLQDNAETEGKKSRGT